MAAKEKILVVDDEPSIRKYLQTLLEVDGFDVEAVSSGKDAIEKISGGERPEFIILDVLMPELNGIETLKELLKIDRTLNIIMLSCSNEVGTVVEAIRIGAHDYLTKPFEKTEVCYGCCLFDGVGMNSNVTKGAWKVKLREYT